MTSFHERLQYVDVEGRQIAAVQHVVDEKRIVVFCHGFRGDKLGPNRFFVRLARRLQAAGIGSLRFDQYGSGDSVGDFFDSSFDDWVRTIVTLTQQFGHDGHQVALLGQSMGGTAALLAAVELGAALSSVVAWMPDPSVDPPDVQGPYDEEGGQRVRWHYWMEAHAANTPARFPEILAPTLVFFAGDDMYVSEENRVALTQVRQPHQHIEFLADYTHSSWNYDQAEYVIAQSADFLADHFAQGY